MSNGRLISTKKKSELDAFLDEAGYSWEDILAYNPSTRRILTKNGGRYKFTASGKILHLGGPSPDPTERL